MRDTESPPNRGNGSKIHRREASRFILCAGGGAGRKQRWRRRVGTPQGGAASEPAPCPGAAAGQYEGALCQAAVIARSGPLHLCTNRTSANPLRTHRPMKLATLFSAGCLRVRLSSSTREPLHGRKHGKAANFGGQRQVSLPCAR